MNQKTLYLSSNLKVFRNVPRQVCLDTLVICFQYKLDSPHLDEPGFAETFFERCEIDAVFINCATNEWYQYEDLPQALGVVQEFASQWNNVITYGSSMGGDAALRFASALGATMSIAVGPHFPPGSLPAHEDRTPAALLKTETLSSQDSYGVSTSVRNYVIYDPLLRIDQRHVTEYARQADLLLIPVPCGGHTPTVLLAQCGMLGDLVRHLIAGSFCSSQFRRAFRKTRTSSSDYWEELMQHLSERGRLDTAKRVADRSRVRIEVPTSHGRHQLSGEI